MLSRTHRFHGHGSLRYVYAQGQVARGPFTVLKHSLNPRRQTWRAAVVVSRKVHKSAVVRNRIRRRIYEIVRLNVRDDVAHDLVFIVHAEVAATLPAEELAQAITAQLKKADVLG